MFVKLYDTEIGQILVRKDTIGEEGFPCIYLTCEVAGGFFNTCLLSESFEDFLELFTSFTQEKALDFVENALKETKIQEAIKQRNKNLN